MDALRVGVVGLGLMGRNHARVYREIGANLAALSDVDPVAARAAATKHQCAHIEDVDAFLRSVDALSVVTPTQHHYDIALKAIEAGKHVLVEKPITATLEQAQLLIAAARKQGVTLAVGHVERHNPVVRAARSMIDKGELGDVNALSSRRVNRVDRFRVRDVGVVLDLAVHDIDVLRFLARAEPETVFAVTSPAGSSREENAHIVMSFPGGVHASLDVNWLTPRKVRRLSITGSKAYAEADYVAQTLEVSTSRAVLNEDNLYATPMDVETRMHQLKAQEPLANELRDFLDAARTGKPPLVTGEDGAAALAIAHAALRSASTGQRVPVEALK